jgi:hypothetical protein
LRKVKNHYYQLGSERGGGTVKRRIFLRIAKRVFVAVGVVGVRSGSVFDELPSMTPFSSYSVFMAG